MPPPSKNVLDLLLEFILCPIHVHTRAHIRKFSLLSDDRLSLSLFIYVAAGRETKVIPPFFLCSKSPLGEQGGVPALINII